MIEVSDATSVISLVDDLIEGAILKGASDIHLEPSKDNLTVRYRVDGVLIPQINVPKSISQQLTSRVKVLANIDIAEKRVPMDGKFCFSSVDQSVDLRVSTFPSVYGENVVIRILDSEGQKLSLDQLGMEKVVLEKFTELIEKFSGFILSTGPTGSGKTTTLYAALKHLKSPEKNIITLEDPVEYSIDGVVQGQVNNQAGFTFAKGIRSIFRQDPDIAMVGEIRDRETAQTAIEMALTGHMVLSTLHTNDSPGAIMRLMDMNIESFLINASVTGVLAQRLLRKLCPECRKEIKPTERENQILEKLKIKTDKVWHAEGCSDCSDVGYKGRVGIFELFVMSNKVRSLISQSPIFDDIYSQVRADGMKTLLEDGIEKFRSGMISLDELVRVVP